METKDSTYFLNRALLLPDSFRLSQGSPSISEEDLFTLITTSDKSRGNGTVNTSVNTMKQTLFDFVAGRPVDPQVIFEQAYSQGVNAPYTYDKEIVLALIEASNQIYVNTLLPIEEITDEGVVYLPQDTVTLLTKDDSPNKLELVKQICLSGFAAGMVLQKKRVDSRFEKSQKPNRKEEPYFNLPQAKQQIIQTLTEYPELILETIFQSPTSINTLETEQKIISAALPDYTRERIAPIIDAKKRAKTSLKGGRTVRVWAKECEDPNFSLAWNMIQKADTASPTSKVITDLLRQKIQSRTNRGLTIGEGKILREIVDALLLSEDESIEPQEVVVDRAAKFNLPESNDPLALNTLPLVPSDILSVLKTVVYRTASSIGELQLTRDVLKRDIASGNIPLEMIEMVEVFLVRYTQQKESTTENIATIFNDYLGKILGRKRKAFSLEGDKTVQSYKKFVPDEMMEEALTIEQQTNILGALSPFEASYLDELPEDKRKSIFYRYIMALATIAECNKAGGRNSFFSLINQTSNTSYLTERLRNDASALIEYGIPFQDLTPNEQRLASSCETFDEINHFIRVVTGLRFEPRVDGKSSLRVRNINKQFLKMIEVVTNKKIARGALKRTDICPPPYDAESYEDNSEQLDVWTIYNNRKNYPYIQTLLNIPGINTQEVSRFFNALIMKYPLEFAVPVLLYTLYEQYGDIDINGVLTQGYENGTDPRKLKCYIIGEGAVQISNNISIDLTRDPFSKNKTYGATAILQSSNPGFSLRSGNPNTEYKKQVALPQEMNQRIAVSWSDEIARVAVQEPLRRILAKGSQVNPMTLNCEFFHIHADEPNATDTQYMSAMIVRAIQKTCEGTNTTVVGMPVVDNAHVTDRIDYRQYIQDVQSQGVEVPEVIFEGSLLMQKIGDELYKYIEPERLVQRGDNVYFKVNDYVEVELYTGIDGIATQACVLNHITNDLYRLNPEGANNAFRNYLSKYYPQSPIAQAFVTSGLRYEQFYLNLLAQEADPAKREAIKDELSNQLGKSLEGYMSEDASSILESLIGSTGKNQSVIPVQILEGFFGEQGKKYKALLQYLSLRIAGLQDIAIYRLAYDPYTGEISLDTLSKDQKT
ncbi:MAG: hypothetical protein NUV65_04535 [Candidatus Roizmanbacteria bacterium]|nr:hypothetical protein [Candidatus Roizmanbacteria bacterium]